MLIISFTPAHYTISGCLGANPNVRWYVVLAVWGLTLTCQVVCSVGCLGANSHARWYAVMVVWGLTLICQVVCSVGCLRATSHMSGGMQYWLFGGYLSHVRWCVWLSSYPVCHHSSQLSRLSALTDFTLFSCTTISRGLHGHLQKTEISHVRFKEKYLCLMFIKLNWILYFRVIHHYDRFT